MITTILLWSYITILCPNVLYCFVLHCTVSNNIVSQCIVSYHLICHLNIVCHIRWHKDKETMPSICGSAADCVIGYVHTVHHVHHVYRVRYTVYALYTIYSMPCMPCMPCISSTQRRHLKKLHNRNCSQIRTITVTVEKTVTDYNEITNKYLRSNFKH